MTAYDETWLIEIVRRLARLRSAPTRVLAAIVARDGACMQPGPDSPVGRPPRWLHETSTDRAVAARLCQGCPVQQECLELELRMSGEQTVGVWGALGEDDRRALVPLWRHAAGPPASQRPQSQPHQTNGGDR
jgi:WhiB family redox-sensing transcriptional regulator